MKKSILEAQAPQDPLAELLAEPLLPLPEHRRSPQQAELLAQARRIEAEQGADAYWGWLAGRLRWMQPWTRIREGGFEDARWFTDGMLNICDNCVDRHAEDPQRSQRTALIWEGEPGEQQRLSYAELRDTVARFANGLKSLGVQQGDVVGLYMPNLPQTMVAIQACNRIGAIHTILFAGFSPDAVATRLQTARAKLVITADAAWRRGKKVPLLHNLRQVVDSVPSVTHVVVVNRTGEPPSLQAKEIDYAQLVERNSADCPCVPLEANAPAFLIFTSGTGAKPKGVVHSVGGFLVGTYANVLWQIGLVDDDVYWCTADVGWLTFPIHAVVGAPAHGGTLVWYEGSIDYPTLQRFYDIARRHAVTKILTAPTVLRMLRTRAEGSSQGPLLPQLRLLGVQGEPLDTESFRWGNRVLAQDLPIINGYGQTETGSTWTYPVAGVDALKAGSCGMPAPGHAGEVVDDEGRPVPAGVRGNLVLTTPFPALARTLWDGHERYVSTYFRRFPGRYDTSDEGVRDKDGHIWVLGRADDVINVAAHRISTMEIESIAAAQDGVADAAVVGVKDAIKGLVPAAFLILRPGADADAVCKLVRAAVDRGIGGIARLERVYISPSLPKTRAGKTMRRLLREAAETGAVSGDLTGLEEPAALAALLEAVAKPRFS